MLAFEAFPVNSSAVPSLLFTCVHLKLLAYVVEVF